VHGKCCRVRSKMLSADQQWGNGSLSRQTTVVLPCHPGCWRVTCNESKTTFGWWRSVATQCEAPGSGITASGHTEGVWAGERSSATDEAQSWPLFQLRQVNSCLHRASSVDWKTWGNPVWTVSSQLRLRPGFSQGSRYHHTIEKLTQSFARGCTLYSVIVHLHSSM
jgi:hypothetical protein